jgi:hypothetical protein
LEQQGKQSDVSKSKFKKEKINRSIIWWVYGWRKLIAEITLWNPRGCGVVENGEIEEDVKGEKNWVDVLIFKNLMYFNPTVDS